MSSRTSRTHRLLHGESTSKPAASTASMQINKIVAVWIICLCCGGPFTVLARPLLSDERHGSQEMLRHSSGAPHAQSELSTDVEDRRASHRVAARPDMGTAVDGLPVSQSAPVAGIDVQHSQAATRELFWQRGSGQLLQSQAAAASATGRSLQTSIDSNTATTHTTGLLHSDLQRRLQQSPKFEEPGIGIQNAAIQPESQQACTCTCSNSSTPNDPGTASVLPDIMPGDSPDSNQLSNELTAASGGVQGAALDQNSSGDVLLLGVRIAPVPAAVLLQRLAAGNSNGADLSASFAADAAAAAASSLNVSAEAITVSLQTRLTLALQLPKGVAAAGSSSPSEAVPGPDVVHLAHDYVTTQAVAEFLEETAGPTSVLVSVNLVQLRNAVKGGSSSSSNGVTIALADITALGDLAQTVAAAAAMVGNCPELFDRGVSLDMTPGADGTSSVTSNATRHLKPKNNTPGISADGDGLWREATGCGKLLLKSYQAVLSSSSGGSSGGSSSSSRDGSSFEGVDVTVVLPLEVNFKLKIRVKIPADKDPQQLAAAAAAWLRSDHVEQLLQQHGLRAGLGSPAQLTTLLPHKVTVVTPDVTTFSNQTADAGGWKRESAAAAADSSKNHTLDLAVELPSAAAADQSHVISETAPQLVLIIVITITGSATVGAAAAAAIAWHWRKKKQLREKIESKGSSSSSSSGAGRRRKRTRGIMKRHSKYLPAGCNMPPGSDARTLLPVAAAAAAAGGSALVQQLSGRHFIEQQQQQEQECEQVGTELATATAAGSDAAVAAAAAGGATVAHHGPSSSSSSSSVVLSMVALQQQQHSHSGRFQPTGLVLPSHSALFQTHSAPVAAAAAAVQQGAEVSTVIVLQEQRSSASQPAAAAAVQPVSRLRRYWSYAQGISGHASISSSDLSGSSALVISRGDLCSDSVSSAVRFDLQQQQQQEGPALSRSSSRSTRSTISSSSIGEHDEMGPQHTLDHGTFLQHYYSSSSGSTADGSGSSSSRGQVLAFAASLDQSGVGISPFQSHYNFVALNQ